MAQLRLIHWHAAEAESLAARLRAGGHTVDATVPAPGGLKKLRDSPPGAFVISLDRMPSQGRYVGMWLRKAKATREAPIVFAGGLPEKVEQVRRLLPDAVYTSWEQLPKAIAGAITAPPRRPVAPDPFTAYAQTPLSRKLGIGAKTRVAALLGAPPTAAETIGDLPPGTRLQHEWQGGTCDVLLWFARSLAEMESELEWIAASAGDCVKLWILWPKRSASPASDLSPALIRAAAQRHGLADYKICSFDATWSGMVFGRKRDKK